MPRTPKDPIYAVIGHFSTVPIAEAEKDLTIIQAIVHNRKGQAPRAPRALKAAAPASGDGNTTTTAPAAAPRRRRGRPRVDATPTTASTGLKHLPDPGEPLGDES
jgi:hypothetical protein